MKKFAMLIIVHIFAIFMLNQFANASPCLDLMWDAPVTRIDGSAFAPEEVEYYTVYYDITNPPMANKVIFPISEIYPSLPQMSCVFTGFGYNTLYYVAVTTTDKYGQESARSNIIWAVTTLASGAPINTILAEEFESGSDRNLSGYNDWVGLDTPSIRIDTNRAYTGLRAVHITPNVSGGIVNYNAFDSAQVGSVFTVDFWLYINNAPTLSKTLIIPSYGAAIYNDPSTFSQEFNLSIDGSIRRGYSHIGYASVGGWTHVEIQYNLDQDPDTFDIWIDDTHYGPYSCTNNNNQVDGISLKAHTSAGQDFHIDDLNVYAGAKE